LQYSILGAGLLVLSTNFEPSQQAKPGTNTPAYFFYSVNEEEKSVIALTPVENVIKLFVAVSYAFSKQALAFVPGKPFQPSLMFGVRP
jgi:hypothetical protein